ncbi:hypothetical protein JCM6882_002220 [Rhodosporidiobolus microsporus]
MPSRTHSDSDSSSPPRLPVHRPPIRRNTGRQGQMGLRRAAGGDMRRQFEGRGERERSPSPEPLPRRDDEYGSSSDEGTVVHRPAPPPDRYHDPNNFPGSSEPVRTRWGRLRAVEETAPGSSANSSPSPSRQLGDIGLGRFERRRSQTSLDADEAEEERARLVALREYAGRRRGDNLLHPNGSPSSSSLSSSPSSRSDHSHLRVPRRNNAAFYSPPYVYGGGAGTPTVEEGDFTYLSGNSSRSDLPPAQRPPPHGSSSEDEGTNARSLGHSYRKAAIYGRALPRSALGY